MKFVYEYRTPDNVKHRKSISAADRDGVFAALKARGIRPERVTEAPGFFNKLFGKGKRWLVIALLGVVCAALCFLVKMLGRDLENVRQDAKEALEIADSLEAMTRRQIIGDSAIIEKGIKNGWSEVFTDEGERFLASFAIPGVQAGQRNTNELELKAALEREIVVLPSDSLETRQIKAMVEGMKIEARQFVADGGSLMEYGQELVKRQLAEIGYYQRAKNALDVAFETGKSEKDCEALWERLNNELRNMGIKLLAWPE